jgi:6-phosphogluconate dehydrogenase
MKIGVIGLGRMGSAIVYRLCKDGHDVVGYNRGEYDASGIHAMGAKTVESLESLAHAVRIFWLMVPAGQAVDQVLEQLIPHLQPQDIIIDGGNSHFRDSIRRYEQLQSHSVSFLDCGTSGGLHGKEVGFSLMIGGCNAVYAQLEQLFKSIAAPQGYGYVGPAGAGHYVKMVHNGIEYALLQAYGEGFHLLHEGYYKDLDLARIADIWQHGSIIRSWILHLSYEVFAHDQTLNNISGKIAESGTGRWSVQEAHERTIPVDLIERALALRAESQKNGGNYATKLVALLRNKFGGHPLGS